MRINFIKRTLVLLFSIAASNMLHSQNVTSVKSDYTIIREIFDEALVNGRSYGNLNYLCKVIGHRLTGSTQAEEAVQWTKSEVMKYGLDRIYLQSIEAPLWIRGDKDYVALSENVDIAMNACALGGSVGTNGPLQASVIMVNGLPDLARFNKEDVEGKIVFFNEALDKRKINTFEAYGACVSQRYAGASEAGKLGAVAVLVRSLTTLTDIFPHTGSMGYAEGEKRIPAAAISTQDADILSSYLEEMGSATVTMNLNCYNAENTTTYNVIAEIKGSEHPEQIIVVGAHLDSWDKGEGAHDDGAGVVQCMEVLRIYKTLGIRPKNTIRMVLYMNEENGNMGGKTYAAKAKSDGENHICAIETDRGGFSPRGFSIDANDASIEKITQWQNVLEPYGLHYFKQGYGGVDIGPLKSEENKVNKNLILMGLYPDSQRYFDYHHSADDVFENVNQRELELGGASMAAMVYLMDKYWNTFITQN
jgi:carboxypeptidase Q